MSDYAKLGCCAVVTVIWTLAKHIEWGVDCLSTAGVLTGTDLICMLGQPSCYTVIRGDTAFTQMHANWLVDLTLTKKGKGRKDGKTKLSGNS